MENKLVEAASRVKPVKTKTKVPADGGYYKRKTIIKEYNEPGEKVGTVSKIKQKRTLKGIFEGARPGSVVKSVKMLSGKDRKGSPLDW